VPKQAPDNRTSRDLGAGSNRVPGSGPRRRELAGVVLGLHQALMLYNAGGMKPETSTIARPAERAVSQIEIIHLSVDDQRHVARSLLRPPKPNAAMKRAFKRRHQLLGG